MNKKARDENSQFEMLEGVFFFNSSDISTFSRILVFAASCTQV